MIKKHFGLLAVLIFLGILWVALQGAAKAVPGTVLGKQEQVEAVRQALSQYIKPGDEIFLASQETSIPQELKTLGANTYSFKPSDQTGFDKLLLGWLDKLCQQEGTRAGGRSYFVWTDDQAGTVALLGPATRALIFFSSFEAVVPYEGPGAFANDKILLLLPRAQLVRRYCEVRKLVGKTPVLVVVDVNEFPPLLGSFNLGSITWLASDATRKLNREDYSVKNIPAGQQFSVWSENWAESWSFTNQDSAAYELALTNTTKQKGLILADRNISLGSVASRYLVDCIGEQPLLQKSSFKQMCLRTDSDLSP